MILNDILDKVKDAIHDAGCSTVYTVFDSIPVENKGDAVFTVVSVDGMETMTPVTAPDTVYIPFRALIGITVTAPAGCPASALMEFYDGCIEKAVESLTGLTSALSSLTLKFDSNIQRLVLSVKIKSEGTEIIERSSE